MDDRQDHRFFWITIFALLLLTRIPAMASYLSIDNVNLAFSLENFDPRVHQPQPPGYPFFVLFGRIIHVIFQDAERTFAAISIIVSALCLPAAFLLGKNMFSKWAGGAAAFLLLVNPVFWHSGLDGPLRPHLALFSLLTSYCCWRCWNGEKRFAVYGAVALGIGSGFRPDLIAFLFPLWLISTWVGTKSWRTVLQGVASLAAIGLVWVGALVLAMGGIETFMKIMLDYAVDQSKPESVVLGSSLFAWFRQINRIVIWNGLAVVTWIWALPFYFRNRDRLPLASAQGVFLFLWLVPGLIVQALVHIGAPGHTLFSVAALCVTGGYVLSLARSREVLLGAALVLNVMLFLDFFTLPTGVVNSPANAPSIKNAILFGTFESSIGQVRWLDDITRTALNEIEQFTPKDRPSVIITTNTYVEQWFMNWRIGRYYLPARDFWVLYNDTPKKRVEQVRRDIRLSVRDVAPLRVPVFREGRILWLIEPYSEVHRQISARQKLNGGRYVFYSEITPDSPAFVVGEFEIVPALFGFIPPQVRTINDP
jgi:4-amino-4-deoxy-L-arabinose transferase-like glycosyltransferase